MHLVAAPDKFRGTSTASDAAAAMALAAEQLGWSCTQLPLADGGEGTLDAFGGANRRAVVTGPNGAIGSAHVCTPVTNAHLLCRLLLEQTTTYIINNNYQYDRLSRPMQTMY